MDYTCVKCKANDHKPGQCQLPKDVQHDAHKIYCASCQAYGHPASYRGCPKIKAFIQRRKDAQTKNQRNENRVSQTEFVNSLVKRGMSYSTATGRNPNLPNQTVSKAVGAEKRSEMDGLKDFFLKALAELNINIQAKLNTLSNSIQDVSARTDFIFDTYCHDV